MSFVVAIDGPAGVGKGTVAELVSQKMGFINIDTGAMFRCVALKALKDKIESNEIEKIRDILKDISIELKIDKERQIVLLDGVDVTQKIRTPEIDDNVAKYAAIGCIRDKILILERKMGEMRRYCNGGKRYWDNSISKGTSKDIFGCFSRGKGKKEI